MSYSRAAADSRTYQTYRNFTGPSLLTKVGGQPTSSSPVQNGSRDGDADTRKRISVSPTNAPPESSSDEDEPSPAQPKTETPPRPKRYGQNLRTPRERDQALEKAEAGYSKRQASSSPLRNSQPKSEGGTESKASSGTSAKIEPEAEYNEPDWLGQRPQKKRKTMATTYSSQRANFHNIHAASRSQKGNRPDSASQETRSLPNFIIPGGDEFDCMDVKGSSGQTDSGFKHPGHEGADPIEMGTKKAGSGFLQPLDLKPPPEKSLDTSVSFLKPQPLIDINISTDKDLTSQLEVAKPNFRAPFALDDSHSPSTHKPFIMPPSTQSVPIGSLTSSSTSIPGSNEPAIFDDPEAHYSSSSSLSSPGSAILSQQEKDDLESDIAAHGTAKCPMCRHPVPRSALQQWLKTKKTTVRHQRQFCKSHGKLDAEGTWIEKGYPIIDWASFDTRIKTFFPRLERIIKAEEPSFYRNAVESSIKSGKDRTLQKAIMGSGGDTLSAGYYGPKGSQSMTLATISRFAPLLRRLSTTDRLLSSSVGGGVPQFVQMVLVPELTVCLVKEDMNVDDEEARVVMKESEGVGMAVNGEEDAEERDLDLVLREEELRMDRERARKEKSPRYG